MSCRGCPPFSWQGGRRRGYRKHKEDQAKRPRSRRPLVGPPLNAPLPKNGFSPSQDRARGSTQSSNRTPAGRGFLSPLIKQVWGCWRVGGQLYPNTGGSQAVGQPAPVKGEPASSGGYRASGQPATRAAGRGEGLLCEPFRGAAAASPRS